MKAGIDYIGSAVFALIFNQEDEVLLVNHILSDKKPKGLGGCWSMAGGTIEFGEMAVEALKREIKEELGIDIFDEELINYNDYIENEHWFALNFSAKTNQTPKNLEPHKIKEIKFFKLSEIPDNLSVFCRRCLEITKNRS